MSYFSRWTKTTQGHADLSTRAGSSSALNIALSIRSVSAEDRTKREGSFHRSLRETLSEFAAERFPISLRELATRT